MRVREKERECTGREIERMRIREGERERQREIKREIKRGIISELVRESE